MANLAVYMNGYRVGTFTKTTSGAHQFQYRESWLAQPGSRPISLSMPLRHQPYRGDEAYNFFDNLLPDNMEVRNRVVARYQAASTQPFDLLSCIGQDSVGALQLVTEGHDVPDVRQIDYKALSDDELEQILTSYKSGIPLGMVREQEEFRISIAGAQEKTALLYLDDRWYLPLNATPTTHIIKLPIGKIESHSYSIDLSQSVENEYLCTLIAKEFGLPVPHCFMMQVGQVKALAVERFDRRYAADRSWIMRLPQEDFCQVLNVPSARKYENHGGPGITDIMKTLLGSATPEQDRYLFMKSQVLFWLLAATDGHAKNFSVFIEPEGRFRLTPFYDILSVYPVFGGRGLNRRDAKLAMGLASSKGKKYAIEQIFPRHFFQTAKAVGFERSAMEEILTELANSVDDVIERATQQLPAGFPDVISSTILEGLKARSARLLKGWD
ncbi:type II toxin-antitoxin system HipA family toxin [Aeromonas veronii]|uniref:type II toxin-antitoxin system HipA family toxin n=1 Tax=Aeromonas TaxID=642 RepID=UPI001A1BAAEF|nr:type II toxin-antitoxin system HipA family toxin [Aeromonas veronii]EGX6959549.1 type II toxin-antitoxin system HipA family toxin [Aeromonas hydrophila]EGX6960787.1 type II toxin-antitoxin system HipA family toxin [Aeromonas hydrophila]WMJ05058.1 type II toxin-antitoxin system HipA family toxin [Aeromonas veronii]HAT1509875.1 type II toxin-antitoxin system HipA family toxin [Aeromonas hydrophila]HAT1511647.1 type II toxin-antitoxin system HipA family toxin [Aeromonas hydrophila]